MLTHRARNPRVGYWCARTRVVANESVLIPSPPPRFSSTEPSPRTSSPFYSPSFPVSASVRRYPPQTTFYSSIEEIIGWLAGVGHKHSLIRLYLNNRSESLAHSSSSSWQQLHSCFVLFITSLRRSHRQFLLALQSTRSTMAVLSRCKGASYSSVEIGHLWALSVRLGCSSEVYIDVRPAPAESRRVALKYSVRSSQFARARAIVSTKMKRPAAREMTRSRSGSSSRRILRLSLSSVLLASRLCLAYSMDSAHGPAYAAESGRVL